MINVLLSTGILAIIVALAVIAALLVRLNQRADTFLTRTSERREWEKK